MQKSNQVEVKGSWVLKAKREDVYAIVSDWERFPERFPKVARDIKIVKRDGNRLTIEALAASFGKIFPDVRVNIEAELLPGQGYRCATHNITFNTTGEEELLLLDDPEGTRVQYTYIVTVRYTKLKPLYAWLTKTFGIPYWKRAFFDRLEELLSLPQDAKPV